MITQYHHEVKFPYTLSSTRVSHTCIIIVIMIIRCLLSVRRRKMEVGVATFFRIVKAAAARDTVSYMLHVHTYNKVTILFH